MKTTNVTFSGRWSNVLINGVVTLALGLLLVLASDTVYKMIVLGLGIAMFIGGLISLIYTIRSQNLSVKNKSFWYIQAVINIIIGIFIFFQPEFVLSMLRYFISIWLIIVGIIQLFYSNVQRKLFGKVSVILVNGLLAIVVGIVFLAWPAFPLLVIGYINIFISIILFYYTIVFYENRKKSIVDNIDDIEDVEFIEETKI